MNNHSKLALLLALALPLLGCMAPGTLEQGESLDLRPLVETVVADHAAYLDADGTLDAAAATDARLEGALFLAAFATPTVDVAPIHSAALAVLQRLESYVLADSSLDPPHRDERLLAVRSIRRTLNAAMGVDGET